MSRHPRGTREWLAWAGENYPGALLSLGDLDEVAAARVLEYADRFNLLESDNPLSACPNTTDQAEHLERVQRLTGQEIQLVQEHLFA